MLGAAPGRHFYGELPRAGLAFEVRPEFDTILLRVQRALSDGAIVIRSDQYRRAEGRAQLKEFIDIGFSGTDRYELGVTSHLPGVLQHLKPPLALFLFNREPLVMPRLVFRPLLPSEGLLR
jgi:hypothetical protein